MSHAPGLDLDKRLEPGDGTKGVAIEAIATGEPQRSWIVIDQPFLALHVCFLPVVMDDNLQKFNVVGEIIM